jgi:transcriptional regulator GlxA family with amidase domain/YHS domain-containing protein
MERGSVVMNRRDLLKSSAALGIISAIPFSRATANVESPAIANPLKPPAQGSIPVAFLISDGAVLIDFIGPWEVFGSVMIHGRMDFFQLYTVAETTTPVRAGGGMKIVPDFTLETAPAPKVIVIPAQKDPSQEVLEWIRRSAKTADVTMSVCTGAYVLAKTGLLNGRSATTHHASYVDFATKFPSIRVQRGVRFVEDGNLASSGGLSSGIDLAFRVVERYFGRDAATQTAYDMEYQGQGWMEPSSNAVYAKLHSSTSDHVLCPVCGMDVDPANNPKSAYKGQVYYFCSQDHRAQFDAAPAKFVEAAKP